MKSINSLDSNSFQDFCSSFLIELFGIAVFPGGRGKDGGRDAIYEGVLRIPNTDSKYEGKWVIQVKYYEKDETTQPTWLRRPLRDLKKEYQKFKDKDHEFNSYLFLTNVSLTWVEDTGTFDKIEQDIKPMFNNIGFSNFLVWDGNKIKSLFPFIEKTTDFFLSEVDNNSQISSVCNDYQNEIPIIGFVCKKVNDGVFNLNNLHNPHFDSKLSWIYDGKKFYLIQIEIHRDVRYVLNSYNNTFHNEILVVVGNKKFIRPLEGKLEYIPIQNDQDNFQEILFNYKENIQSMAS